MPQLCPPIKAYSADKLERAQHELEQLAEGSVLLEMLSDYLLLRDQVRRCA